ncbi:MAG: serine/threonine-protein kinase, partial [Planctomycetota bacterium]
MVEPPEIPEPRDAGAQRGVPTMGMSEPAPPSSRPAERFPPGTMLSDRYRVVARVGRGGMGEVYRADDLKLGQSVALKFLPRLVAADDRWLDRFHSEVRIAREVAHPNVCRVYDIVEDQGEHFIAMEFIDGEDLDSLLKRIGRLPKDKGIQIARQLCAGLAAAHDKGVLHRDLKPANVMIDGRGNARITDFGIAALADELDGREHRAGTPAYMSPEQLDGKPLTARSDVFSLGLVLYEIFTGREAFAGETIEELRRSRSSGTASRPSSLVEDMDPLVERIILRCLDPNPDERPSSAIAVAAGLPGGDPLALALAAGETPSPEMVAHAGVSGSLRPAVAVTLLVTAALLAGVSLWSIFHGSFLRHGSVEYSPAVLQDRARQTLAAVGVDRPAHESWHFHFEHEALSWLAEQDQSPQRWSRLAEGFPSPVLFHYRGSP